MDMKQAREMFPSCYDLFMNNSTMYRGMLGFFVKNLRAMDSVLDAGSGTGNLTLRLLKERCYVTAIDRFGHLLKILEEKCSGHSHFLKTHYMDATELDFNAETFDGVGSMFLIPMPMHYDFRKHLFEAHRVLKNGGKLIIASLVPNERLLTDLHTYLKKEMTAKGMIKKHLDEWKILMGLRGFRKHLVLSRNITQESTLKEVKGLGFNNVAVIPESQNPYGKYAYVIICTK